MSVIHLPPLETKKWTQPNMGDVMGVLWATFNLDMNLRRGKVNVSKLTYAFASVFDDAQIQYPHSALRTKADGTDRWWYGMHGYLFKTTGANPASGTTQDAIADTPSAVSHLRSDMVEHEGAMIVSLATDITRLASGTWATSWWQTTLSQAALSNVPHPMDVFNRVLLIADGNFLHTVDRNSVAVYKRLTLPSDFEIRWIEHGVDRIWIGAKNIYGRPAEVFEWDGYTADYLRRHQLVGDITFAGVVKDGVPYTVTNAGLLMAHNGSTFTEVEGSGWKSRFPIFNEDVYYDPIIGNANANWQDGWTDQFLVHWNGMAVIDNMVHVLISGSVAGTEQNLLENMKSGIWCLDEDVGLYHRFGLSAQNGSTQIDFATEVIDKPGFLCPVQKQYGRFICGAVVNQSNTGTLHGVFVNDTGSAPALYNSRGYFITTQIQTANVREQWDKIWAKLRKFKASGDAIIIKTRSSEDVDYNFPFRASFTWSGTGGATMTSTSAGFANVEVGDEVEILQGQGAGTMAHVASISLATGTYTIGLDESIGTVTASSTGQVRVVNWRKLGKLSDADASTAMGEKEAQEVASWIQYKVEIRSRLGGTELEELIIATTENLNPNA